MASSIAARVILMLLLTAGVVAQQAPGADAVMRDLTAKASHGDLDQEAATDALMKAGMDAKGVSSAIDALNKVLDDFKKAKAKDAKDQNASGSGDWNFGQVYRDRDYNLTMSVSNNCKLAQTVSITYPGNVIMEGPGSVMVPPKSKVDVPMKLILTRPPLPMPPWPIGVNMSCYDIADNLTLVHPELKQVIKTATGTDTYICEAMKRTYKLTMHVHQHGPQTPQPPGGGGSGDPRKKNPACTALWNHGEFVPNTTMHAPEQCVRDVRDQAHDFFGTQLDALRAKSPQAWAWAPGPAEIDRMSAEDLVALKARADAQARGQR